VAGFCQITSEKRLALADTVTAYTESKPDGIAISTASNPNFFMNFILCQAIIDFVKKISFHLQDAVV
jgi:hypothetical protein